MFDGMIAWWYESRHALLGSLSLWSIEKGGFSLNLKKWLTNRLTDQWIDPLIEMWGYFGRCALAFLWLSLGSISWKTSISPVFYISVTDGRTDRSTDGYRDGRTHLKIRPFFLVPDNDDDENKSSIWMIVPNQKYSVVVKNWLTDRRTRRKTTGRI